MTRSRWLLLITALLLLLTACGDPAATESGRPTEAEGPTSSDPPETAGTEGVEGELLASIHLDPNLAELFVPVATDPSSRQWMVDIARATGGDVGAIAAADLDTSLLAAFDLGECTTGEATLVLRDGQLDVEGRESDGICESIDHEVQIWAVPWTAIPDGITIDGSTILPPAEGGRAEGQDAAAVVPLGVVLDDGSLATIADGPDAVAVDAAGIERMAAAIAPVDGRLAAAIRQTDPAQLVVVAFHHDSCAGPRTTTTIQDGHPTFTVDTQGIDCEAPIPAVAVAAISWRAIGHPAEVAIAVDGDREVIATIADGQVRSR